MKKIGELPDEGVVAGVVAFSLAPPTAMTKLSALIVAAHSWLRAERLKQEVKVKRGKVGPKTAKPSCTKGVSYMSLPRRECA